MTATSVIIFFSTLAISIARDYCSYDIEPARDMKGATPLGSACLDIDYAFDRRSAELTAFPAYEHSTAFEHTDPHKDQSWVVTAMQKAAEIKDNLKDVNLAFDIARVAAKILPIPSPVGQLIKLGESLVNYYGPSPSTEPSTIELDLANVVDRIMQLSDDQVQLSQVKEAVADISDAITLTKSTLIDLQNDYDLRTIETKILAREDGLKSVFKNSFIEGMLDERPEAAWFMFDPIFALMDMRFQFMLKRFKVQLMMAAGAESTYDDVNPRNRNLGMLSTACGDLEDFKEGPMKSNGKRDRSDPASLSYMWDLLMKYFDTAFEARLALIEDRGTCTSTDSGMSMISQTQILLEPEAKFEIRGLFAYGGTTDRKNFGAKYTWSDGWDFGSKAAKYTTGWSGYVNDHKRRLPGLMGWDSNHYCQVAINGQGKGISGTPKRMEIEFASRIAAYKYSVGRKQEAIRAKFQEAYNAMRVTIDASLDICQKSRAAAVSSDLSEQWMRTEDLITRNQVYPNGPVKRDVLRQECIEVQEMPTNLPCPDGFDTLHIPAHQSYTGKAYDACRSPSADVQYYCRRSDLDLSFRAKRVSKYYSEGRENCKMCVSGEQCWKENYVQYFDRVGDSQKSFVVKSADTPWFNGIREQWKNQGKKLSVQVQLWREIADSGVEYNPAYQGEGNMLPVRQGPVMFHQVSGSLMRGDQYRDVEGTFVDGWQWISQDDATKDAGRLRFLTGGQAVRDVGFRAGDLLCMFHKTTQADRDGQNRAAYNDPAPLRKGETAETCDTFETRRACQNKRATALGCVWDGTCKAGGSGRRRTVLERLAALM